MKQVVVFTILLLAGAHAWAEPRWVTDQTEITLRAGAGVKFKVSAELKSGDRMELIDSDTVSGWSKVKTADGKTGFVLTRYLDAEPSARERLVTAEARLQELQSKPEVLGNQLTQVRDAHEKLRKDYDELLQLQQGQQRELETIRHASANAVAIASERLQLRQQVASMIQEVEDLKQEKRELERNSEQRWFLYGGGVVLLGVLIGLILPNIQTRRQKKSWNTL